jgi:hypothetical protein
VGKGRAAGVGLIGFDPGFLLISQCVVGAIRFSGHTGCTEERNGDNEKGRQ